MNSAILTVVTPSDTFDLTEIGRVKREMNITDSDRDELLTDLIHEESASFADMCTRVFASETVTETFYIRWLRCEPLSLARYPVTSITSITEDGVTLDPTLYELDAASGLLHRLSAAGSFRSTWMGSRTIVTYVGGYTLLTNLPRKIEAAVITMVKNRWFAKTRDPAVKVEDVVDVARLEYWVGAIGDGLPPDVQDAVDTYRDVRI